MDQDVELSPVGNQHKDGLPGRPPFDLDHTIQGMRDGNRGGHRIRTFCRDRQQPALPHEIHDRGPEGSSRLGRNMKDSGHGGWPFTDRSGAYIKTRPAISARQYRPSNAMRPATPYARSRAAWRESPQAVTPSTRPPAVTTSWPFQAVPA